ncbi:hypothetical protein CHLNCDRAFT_137063 [Chlorella variabilis]|uniref:Uncharacterized protein n=1 Tax=Chlorella variabilis TaxID=554065 RepID=E1ZLW9_CHLVA|nr:hypothetical protein CHLNCDRAFT_137063 [Chlorella variabilis]EFN53337.1 hypothetical protein CHLNCDRAFT_137063 [Chlorella variabilis]|eukprot:XP_005845439.1 hypothetical protein CHLNCDRAFT_137063 [Chlorella variabilis]
MRTAALLGLLLAAAAASLAPLAAADAPQKKGKVVGGPKDAVRPEDIPYIKCQVCQLLSKNAWLQVKEMKKASTPANPVDENKVIERMEKITTGE